MPEGPKGTIVGQLSLADEIQDLKNEEVKVFVEGYQAVSTTISANATFQLDGVPVGERAVIIVSSSTPTALTGEAQIGAKTQAIKVIENSVSNAGTTILKHLGAINGKVSLEASNDLEGIYIFIPGTTFMAKTDNTGSYTIPNVPEGSYSIVGMKNGFAKGYVKDVIVVSKQSTTASLIELKIKIGVDGVIELNQGDQTSPSRTVSVDISHDGSAILMMMSEDVNFVNSQWREIAETTEYTFSKDGKNRLYARLADSNGLETAPIYADIVVDTASPEGSVSIPNNPEYISTRNISLIIAANDLSKVTEMIVCENADFSGCSWENYAAAKAWILSEGNGTKTIYAKFRDEWGYESDYDSTVVSLDTTVPISGSISANHGPFTNSREIALTLSANSDLAPVVKVALSEDLSLTNATYIDFSARTTFQLSETEGSKTIYAKFIDAAGNESSIVSTAITLDRTTPLAPVFSNTARRTTSSTEVINFVSGSSDTNFQTYQAKGGQYEDWTDVEEPIRLEMNSENKWYEFKVKAKDFAGNVGPESTLKMFRGSKSILNRDASIVNNHLIAAFSPYIATSNGNWLGTNVIIDAGVKLYVDPLVLVEFVGDTFINGTKDYPVQFVSSEEVPAAGDWDGPRFTSTDNQTKISYLTVRHNTGVLLGANYNRNSVGSYIINDSEFVGEGGLVAITSSPITINNSKFSCDGRLNKAGLDLRSNVVGVFNGSKLLITGCYFGVNIGDKYVAQINDSIIQNNVITGESGDF